jgi:hypothetical protein
MARNARSVASTGPTLFPIPRRAIRVDSANLGTMDCPCVCLCDDSCEYAIKDGHTNPLVPHIEWFCTRLAELVGIPGPDCQIIEMPDGSRVFGSRWEGGVLPDTPAGTNPTWVAKVQSGDIPLDGLRLALTRIYAFDHFVHNPDRHSRNFLVREQRQGHALLAFDYSRAWVLHGVPPPALPFNINDPNERTVKVQRGLAQLFGSNYIDAGEALRILNHIKRVQVSAIVRIIDEHPKEWLPTTQRQRIIKWWKSKEMIARIDGIAKGIGDGTYL